ncbi:MAG: ATP-binding protein [gamma proteobacterium endosymbiont of Lamellibrachia anaximandri]|nr:ATP-binding protein [gamma proteobacterium endosymbiont of Lamellibrachia anaximandri]MBL3534892.1 ATP-binding protein [gamma proteobacterium endosymbiont of Lamellibrachia anaximandri]
MIKRSGSGIPTLTTRTELPVPLRLNQPVQDCLSRRYEEKSTPVTTNRSFAERNEVFPNASCVVSLVDRLIHRSEILTIDGASYHLKEAKKRTAPSSKAKAAQNHSAIEKGRQIMTPLKIPNDWSPREALAVYTFIDEIRDAIWNRYDLQLIELMKE